MLKPLVEISCWLPLPQTIVICLLRGIKTCYLSWKNILEKTTLHLSLLHIRNKRTFTFTLLVAWYATMAEPAESPVPVATPSPSPSFTDIFDGLSTPSKPGNKWPTLSPASSTIPPAQKVPSLPASWMEKISQNACNTDFKKIREKYVKYFDGNRIFPIPELVEQVRPRTISFVVTELKTRRLGGIKKETFEGLLKAAGIPAKYYCRRSFATWDVLLPSQELAAKLAGESINSKYFRLQPEYMGRRRIRITVCNVPIELNEVVLAAFLCKYGDIENISKAKSSSGTAHGDYVFTMCLDRGGFAAISHTLEYETQVMTVVVEGMKPQCWNCKQLGHFSKSCPQKTIQPVQATATTATIAAAATTSTTKTTTTTMIAVSEGPNSETGDHPDKDEEGWNQVQREREKQKKKTPTKTNSTTATITVTTKSTTTTEKQQQPASSATAKTQPASSATAKQQQPASSSSATAKKSQGKNKEKKQQRNWVYGSLS